MQKHRFLLKTPEHTYRVGHWFGTQCRPSLFIGLNGELGAGKTLFSQGFAQGFGISERLTSPTYNLLNVYEGPRGKLFHLDVYRLQDVEEVFELGIEDALVSPSIILMEWKSKFSHWPLKIPSLDLELSHHPQGRALCFNAPFPHLQENFQDSIQELLT